MSSEDEIVPLLLIIIFIFIFLFLFYRPLKSHSRCRYRLNESQTVDKGGEFLGKEPIFAPWLG